MPQANVLALFLYQQHGAAPQLLCARCLCKSPQNLPKPCPLPQQRSGMGVIEGTAHVPGSEVG